MSDRPTNETPASTAELLANVDHDAALRMIEAVHNAGDGVQLPTALWAIAMLQAEILTTAPPDVRVWAATQLAELCAIALRMMLTAKGEFGPPAGGAPPTIN